MSRVDLLVEIGTEEIPAGYLPPAVEQLRAAAAKLFADERLVPESVETHATPRRLVLKVRGLPERQEDRTEEVTGPPWKAAWTADGQPTKAAEGFARGRGLTVQDLRQVETERGPYVGATVQIPGRSTDDVLAAAMPGIIGALAFPKTMRWGPDRFRFARPIRWMVALLGDGIVPFSIEGVSTGRLTYGHRILAKGPYEVAAAADYDAALEKGRVILRAEDRAARIETLLAEAAERTGGALVPDPGLVREVAYLVEMPSVFVGSFDAEYLELPAAVITTAMRDHQRYFAVADAAGKLLPHFLCVANSAPEAVDQVMDGNQRVLRARLDDARFYWNEDLKTTLEEKVPSLDRVVWLEGFGSVGDKSTRGAALADWLARDLSDAERRTVERAGKIAKADLVTEMIKDGKEFTALQGVIGREYALAQGETAEVAAALEEQYRPRHAGDRLPESAAGACLALADRLDTMVGVWAAGLKPTGSKDPFALRRGALGVLRILMDRGQDVSVEDLLRKATEGYPTLEDAPAIVREASEFVRERLAGLLTEEEGLPADVVAAVVRAAGANPLDARARAEALAELRAARAEDFTALAAGFKRARNILKKESVDTAAPEAGLLQEPAERKLFEAFAATEARLASAAGDQRYADAFAGLAGLRGPIDEFFDQVLVNAEDDAVRRNRLRLLSRIVDRIQGLADLSRLTAPEESRV